MASVKKIGVLTGGGDAPGLNAVIRAVVKAATNAGVQVLGLEDSFDAKLSGTDGSVTYDRGSDGVVIPGSYRDRHDAINGATVQLTLDNDIQYYVQQQVEQAGGAEPPVTRQQLGGADQAEAGDRPALAGEPPLPWQPLPQQGGQPLQQSGCRGGGGQAVGATARRGGGAVGGRSGGGAEPRGVRHVVLSSGSRARPVRRWWPG